MSPGDCRRKRNFNEKRVRKKGKREEKTSGKRANLHQRKTLRGWGLVKKWGESKTPKKRLHRGKNESQEGRPNKVKAGPPGTKTGWAKRKNRRSEKVRSRLNPPVDPKSDAKEPEVETRNATRLKKDQTPDEWEELTTNPNNGKPGTQKARPFSLERKGVCGGIKTSTLSGSK